MGLCLVLNHMRSKMTVFRLGQAFGLIPSNTSHYLFLGQRCLVRVLADLPDAEVRWPTPRQMKRYSKMVARRYPLLQGVWGAADGLLLPTFEPVCVVAAAEPHSGPPCLAAHTPEVCVQADVEEQRALYTGWKSGTYISNLFAFAPDGTIVYSVTNYPGSQHDSALAADSGFYDTLAKMPPGRAIATDTAFRRSGDMIGKIVRGSKNLEARQGSVRFETQVVSFRQSAEWGMRGFQAMNPRLLNLMPADAVERALLLDIAVGMYQLRARHVGRVQISSVYGTIRKVKENGLIRYRAEKEFEW